MSKGKLIVIEGCDGSGKSTVVKLLQQTLEKQNRRVQVVNILKDHPASAKVRAITTGVGNDLTPEAEACLYAGAVLNTHHLVIKPLLEQGVDVICDRSFISTLVYQGMDQFKKGNSHPLTILQAAYSGANGIVPDVLIMLYVDTVKGLERVVGRDSKLDRIEERGVAYQTSVQDAYQQYVAENRKNFGIIEYTNNDSLTALETFVGAMGQVI